MSDTQDREAKRPKEGETAEPGRTPGTAEGGALDEPDTAAEEAGRTPGQAEGDLETVEESIREKEEKEK